MSIWRRTERTMSWRGSSACVGGSYPLPRGPRLENRIRRRGELPSGAPAGRRFCASGPARSGRRLRRTVRTAPGGNPPCPFIVRALPDLRVRAARHRDICVWARASQRRSLCHRPPGDAAVASARTTNAGVSGRGVSFVLVESPPRNVPDQRWDDLPSTAPVRIGPPAPSSQQTVE